MESKNFTIAVDGVCFDADQICRKLKINRVALKIRLHRAKGNIFKAVPQTVLKQLQRSQTKNNKHRVSPKLKVPVSSVIMHDGVSRTIKQWAKLKGLRVQTIIARIQAGWPEEILLTTESSHPKDVNGTATDPEAWLGCTPEQIALLREFESLYQTARWE